MEQEERKNMNMSREDMIKYTYSRLLELSNRNLLAIYLLVLKLR